MQSGALLVNLGSPASPGVRDVRRYLGEFLMDPYVVDLPWAARRALVSAVILPFRPRRSAAAYRTIWRDDEPGSPLVFHAERLRAALEQAAGVPVAAAMRYGAPSIVEGLRYLAGWNVDRVLLIPLYPHHADSTRSTSIDATARAADGLDLDVDIDVLPPFYRSPVYIGALAAVTRQHLADDVDHVLMSYHGLPKRHLTRADPTGRHCLALEDCCERESIAHATCYRHQVRVTSRLLADALGLDAGGYTIGFQSRLGRAAWLEPYTDELLVQLAGRDVRRLAVVCPAFVADNLETLEEIGIRGRAAFLDAGGERLDLIPCLNDHPDWVAALAGWIRRPPGAIAEAARASG